MNWEGFLICLSGRQGKGESGFSIIESNKEESRVATT